MLDQPDEQSICCHSEPLYNQTAVRFPAKVNCRQEKSNQSDFCRFDFTKASLWLTSGWQRSFATDSFSFFQGSEQEEYPGCHSVVVRADKKTPTPRAEHFAPPAETNLGTGQISWEKNKILYTFTKCCVDSLLVMRFPRVKAQGRSFYHCISRFVHGLFIFGTSGGYCTEAEEFLSLMRRWAAFTGIRIVDYVLMANHFHILCEVPEPKPLTQNEMLERIEAGYGAKRLRALREQLTGFAEQPDGVEQSKRLLDPYRQQMNDPSFFMKQLKGCFAQRYNRRHKRHGTLWSERFKSVLLEGGPAVAAIAAYIDLNPVRAGLCEDPKNYR
jgi:REP element-mobilizing transposase RayT